MENQIISGLKSYLTFKIGSEKFAVNIGHVKKILEMTHITRVPQVPDHYLGVINLFGNVLPVIDGRSRFGIERKENDVNTCIVVLMMSGQAETFAAGIVVDQVLEVLNIDDADLTNPPVAGKRFQHDFIRSIANVKEEFIIVLNENKLFEEENFTPLNSNQE